MLTYSSDSSKSNSLLNEYSAILGDAALRHRARTAENTAKIEAALANKVKSEFISNMSHELRTPLNTVIGFSKILSEHNTRRIADDEIVEYAGLINDAAAHLLAVINDILDISKIQSGRYTLDEREVDIEEVIRSAVGPYRAMAEKDGLTFKSIIGIDLPHVRGDSSKLKRAFANIMTNAVKFTPADGRIELEVLRANEGISILVRDTGVGMSQEEIDIALSTFGQVDGSRTRWREGTGLGLPIAKSLIELHGGTLNVESKKDVGTEVSIYLPSANQVVRSSKHDTFKSVIHP